MKSVLLIACLPILFLSATLEARDAPTDTVERVGNMVKIPAGVFWMGSNTGEGFTNEQPYHMVYLDEYWIDIFEVTIEEYVGFLNTGEPGEPEPQRDRHYNPLMRDATTCGIHPNPNGSYSVVPGREGYPVTYVSWESAKAYAKWVGKRLPTEAEWEKAARGGVIGSSYGSISHLSQSYVNIFGRRNRDYWDYSSPVGVFPPNGYGIYDMIGNVCEWVEDYYNPNSYQDDLMSNPINSPDPENTQSNTRIIRGGSWADMDEKDNLLRVSSRGPHYPIPDSWDNRIGFRCAGSSPPEIKEVRLGIDGEIERLREKNPLLYEELSTDSLRNLLLAKDKFGSIPEKSDIKSMKKAMAFSAILPGTGEIYSGRWYSGLFFLTAEVGGWSYYLINHRDAKNIRTSFADFADLHFSYSEYDAWLNDYMDSHGGRMPPNYAGLELFEVVHGSKTTSAKVKSAYYRKIEHDQFLGGWDDYNVTADTYGSSQNRDYYVAERASRRARKSDYDGRTRIAGTVIIGNHVLSLIDTIWGLKRHTVYRSKGWSWDMRSEILFGDALHSFNVRYRW